MTEYRMVLAGFGGQGILFLGKVIANAGLICGREVSWLPSYGPEMRGGTANCCVCVSDRRIGSPLVTRPNVLVAMNRPAYDKFIGSVEPGGIMLVDSSLVPDAVSREDITTFRVPATAWAVNDLDGLANMIMLGRLFRETEFCPPEALRKGLQKSVPARRQAMLDANFRAVELGRGQE